MKLDVARQWQIDKLEKRVTDLMVNINKVATNNQVSLNELEIRLIELERKVMDD